MSRESTLIVLGVLIIITPSAGLPQSWVAVLIPLFGLLVVILAYAIRANRIREKSSREPMVSSIT